MFGSGLSFLLNWVYRKTDPYFMNLHIPQSFSAGYQKIALLGMFVILIMISTSCVDSRKLKYFSNLSDSQVVHLPALQRSQATIMPDDILDIKIAGANEATSALLNTYSTSPGTASGGAAAATSNTNSNTGYMVDINGDIEFPVIGKIKAGGLTKDQFKELLKERVSKYLKDPLISVKFANFRFTILGEVRIPGSFVVPNERVTVLEAIGLAGDMTGYGRRSGVKILRDSSGVREIGMIDFADKALFTSKYYYLQRNDVIYIEPEKYKTRFEDISRISAVLATVVSLLAITITIIKR